MASPFRALLEPLFLVFGLFVVRPLEKFMELFGNGEIAVLLR